MSMFVAPRHSTRMGCMVLLFVVSMASGSLGRQQTISTIIQLGITPQALCAFSVSDSDYLQLLNRFDITRGSLDNVLANRTAVDAARQAFRLAESTVRQNPGDPDADNTRTEAESALAAAYAQYRQSRENLLSDLLSDTLNSTELNQFLMLTSSSESRNNQVIPFESLGDQQEIALLQALHERRVTLFDPLNSIHIMLVRQAILAVDPTILVEFESRHARCIDLIIATEHWISMP